jgi:hypothetical protein
MHLLAFRQIGEALWIEPGAIAVVAAPMFGSDTADAGGGRALLDCGRLLDRERAMSGLRILAIVLIAGGVLGLVYHHFSYTQDTQEAKVGSLELSVSKKHTVDVPEWIAVGAVVAGAAVLLMGGGARR